MPTPTSRTPWRVIPDRDRIENADGVPVVSRGDGFYLPVFPDAEECDRIVTGVNNHARLLSALKALRAWAVPGMNWTDDIGRELLAEADAAIAGAEGGAS